jgi:hypothetical protein
VLGVVALAFGALAAGWLLSGGPGRVLRGERARGPGSSALLLLRAAGAGIADTLGGAPPWLGEPGWLWLAAAIVVSLGAGATRLRARAGRRYVRMSVQPYRTDRASAETLVAMYAALHKRVLRRWWRRVLLGQPSVALEIHHGPHAWFALSCPAAVLKLVEAALRGAYGNCVLARVPEELAMPPVMLRLKKQSGFIRRAKTLDRFEQDRNPPVNRLLTTMAANGGQATVQLALTPAPALFERFAAHEFRRREAELSRRRRQYPQVRDRSLLTDAELRGGLEVQHRPLFFTELRVLAHSREACEQIASELRAESAENRLVERGTALRHGVLCLYRRRVQRGEGNPIPCFHKGVFAATELAALWQLPSTDYATVPLDRGSVPLAPAPPGVFRPPGGRGILRDAHGPVSIHPELRRQNTAAPGTVEQGKSSFLVATVAEDLRRDRCAVIVLDPKGDAADATLSAVPEGRTCTLLDLSNPTCGFNPLAVDAPGDVIADYVVGALKNLFTDADIRASSDRYLRNAIIAVLAFDGGASLWDAARLLSVGEDGYAYRSAVGAHVRGLPEYKEIVDFFTSELSAQLADARGTTTAKLDAPVNKLARLLNSASIKRVLLNESLSVDLDRTIAQSEVLVVKGALGAMGAGNTAVLMQLLVGMLDAALARQQDLVPAEERVAVALKIDEAPLVLNRGFADTIALKRSAGLETVACWQTDAQWTDRDLREQLDALFAHRVYFATASVRDARAAAPLTMAEFSDSVRPGIAHLATLGHPDVRLHLPKHHAIVSFAGRSGRQSPFVARTLPMRVDPARIATHARRQHERGGRRLEVLRQPHWRRSQAAAGPGAEGRRRALIAPRGGSPPTLERTAAAGYRELVELDGTNSMRRVRLAAAPRELDPDALDLRVLALVASYGHVLSSQLHRCLNEGRAPSTTQRRLKRLADAGLLGRIQFHRRDGGGVPMCCELTTAGARALATLAGPRERDAHADRRNPTPATVTSAAGGRVTTGASPADVRHELHVAGWALAFERAVRRACAHKGARESVLSPPTLLTGGREVPLGLAGLRLPAGYAAHDFLRTAANGERAEVDRFETVRPDATIGVGGVDALVERDDRLPPGAITAKLERYDHFLAGWALHTRRYGRRMEAAPVVVFVCRDRNRARQLARHADRVLAACRAYAGEYPCDWEYPGRAAVVFVAERDAHEGSLWGYAVPRLPPNVRVASAQGDQLACELTAEPCEILRLAPSGHGSAADATARSPGRRGHHLS